MIVSCTLCGRTYSTLDKECLCAENNRYREALERIVACYPHELGEAYTMQRIAREALVTSQVLTADNKDTRKVYFDDKYYITDEGKKAIEEYYRKHGHP